MGSGKMRIYDYYKEKYPQFDWESLNHHGFSVAIMRIGLCKTHKRDGDGGLYRCEIVNNQVYGYLGTTGVQVKGYIDKEVEKEFIKSLEDGSFYKFAEECFYTRLWKYEIQLGIWW